MSLVATSSSRVLTLVAIPNSRALDVGLAAKSCYESVITKKINIKNEIKKKIN